MRLIFNFKLSDFPWHERLCLELLPYPFSNHLGRAALGRQSIEVYFHNMA